MVGCSAAGSRAEMERPSWRGGWDREAPALCIVPDREEQRRPVLARMNGEAAQLWLIGVFTVADKSCSLKRAAGEAGRR
jgi:hypothetical protein